MDILFWCSTKTQQVVVFSRLKSLSVETETVSVNFLYTNTLKFICLFCTLNDHLTYEQFYNIMYCLSRKYWFLKLIHIFQMLAYFIKKYQNITFGNIAIRLRRKVFQVLDSCQAHNIRYWFPKILILFSWKFGFYHRGRMLSAVLLEWQAYLIHF